MIELKEITTPDCSVCKMLKPAIASIISKMPDKVKLTVLDAFTGEGAELAKEHSVRSVPVFLFYKNNELVKRHDGSISPLDLKKLIEELDA